jgi:hypothetical protein
MLRLLLLLGALFLLHCGQPEASESADYLFAQLKSRTPLTQARLAVCALFHNERPYLAEWVLYHWVLGFDHFYLYDNESDDSPAAALAPLVARGLVTLVDWPGAAAQGRQLAHCFNRSRTDVQWMANFDVDEFVVVAGQRFDAASLRSPRELAVFAGRLEEDGSGALLLDRLEYDANNNSAPPPGLVIANYDSRSVGMRVSSVVGKVVVLMRALDAMLSAHDVQLLAPEPGARAFKKVTADWETYEEAHSVRHHRPEPVRINHYVTRSYSECAEKLTQSRWPELIVWRKKNGLAMCDRQMVGKQGYVAHEHSRDTTLSGSLLPALLGRLIARIEEDCACSLH